MLTVSERLARLEYEFYKYLSATNDLLKGLNDAVRGPENEPEKGLLSIVANHDKRHRLFDYVVRSVLVAVAIAATAVLGKIALMVQSAKLVP